MRTRPDTSTACVGTTNGLLVLQISGMLLRCWKVGRSWNDNQGSNLVCPGMRALSHEYPSPPDWVSRNDTLHNAPSFFGLVDLQK